MLRFYGIDAPRERTSETARILELLRIRGFAELPGLLTRDEVSEYCDRLDAVYAQQEAEFGRELLDAIGERDMARCPLAYDSSFLKLPTDARVLEVVRAMLGEYVVLHLQNGIINRPRKTHHQSSVHRDMPHQEIVSSRPLALSVFFCLEDFNRETGGTIFLPFSHREEKIPSREYLETMQVQPEIQAGCAVFFDAMLFHWAGYNSSDRIRRGVNHVFTTGILRQQIDIPGLLPEQNPELHAKAIADPELSILLGYDARTADSVRSFRQRRLDRVQADSGV